VFVWKAVADPAPGAVSNKTRPPTPVPAEPLAINRLPTKGNPHARAAIIEYSDFECPFCRQFYEKTLPALEREYMAPGKVLLVFSHLPLVIHRDAFEAAEAAECARAKDGFWRMHDFMFLNPASLGESALLNAAKTLSLGGPEFDGCLVGHQMKANVLAAAQTAAGLQISSTPTFLAGSITTDGRVKVVKVLAGFQTIESLRPILDQLTASQ
jgi:protein-disulfide isomerase